MRVGEKAAGKNDKLKSGMAVSVELPVSPEELDGEPDWEEILHPTVLPQPQEIPLDIVYEDEHLLVVNKPRRDGGPSRRRATSTGRWSTPCSSTAGDSSPAINGVIRPGIVHRIDKDTSGLLVVAKTDEAHQALCASRSRRTASTAGL